MREEWLSGVVQTLQVAVGATLIGDISDVHQTVAATLETISAPESLVERIALRLLLLEFALRSAGQIHARLHHAEQVSCSFQPEGTLLPFFKGMGIDPKETFFDWLHFFFSALALSHPQSDTERALDIIHRDHKKSLSTSAIARELGLASASLRRAFPAEFDTSVRKYLERVRIVSAMQILDGGSLHKVESVANEVGYHSKKNFYRAFHSISGMTPKEFLQLPSETRRCIVNKAARDENGKPPLDTKTILHQDTLWRQSQGN